MTAPISFQELKDQALALGWDDVGVTAARIPDADIAAYRAWIAKGHHDELRYMENEVRCDPKQIFPGAQTAILFVSYYKQPKEEFQSGGGVVASYARGRDYHNVHRSRLKKMICWLEERSGEKDIARGFSDSVPILERALAVQAGLGWFGKNNLVIHRRFGTFFLLSGLLTSLDLPQEILSTRVPRCGSCTRCLDACPTNALRPYELNASLCLSNHLIEKKGPTSPEIQKKNPGYVFGCDICQDACPHNFRKPNSVHPEWSPEQGLGGFLTIQNLDAMNGEALYGTPLKRRGLAGLKSNCVSYAQNEDCS